MDTTAKCDNPQCTVTLGLGEGVTFAFLYPVAELEATGERVLTEVTLRLCPECLERAREWVMGMLFEEIASLIAAWDKDHPRHPLPPWWPGSGGGGGGGGEADVAR